MTEPLKLVPLEVVNQMLKQARRESMWQTAALVFLSLLVSMIVFVALMLLPSQSRAQSIPDEAHQYRRDIIRATHHVWGIQFAPSGTFAAQIHQESRYRPAAKSYVGALGIAQFMPATARWIQGAYPKELSGDVMSPEWGILALVRYNRHIWERLSAADNCERMAFTLAGYNGGEGWVAKRKKLSDQPDVCLFATCEINPGIKPSNQAENAGYPKRILITLEPLYVAAGFGQGSCSR